MKRYTRITQRPYRPIIIREWRRARRLLAPTLDWVIVPPTVLWDRRRTKSRLAYTIGSFSKAPALQSFVLRGGRPDLAPQIFHASAIICICADLTDPAVFLWVLRHEIAHLPIGSRYHNARFRALQRILNDVDHNHRPVAGVADVALNTAASVAGAGQKPKG